MWWQLHGLQRIYAQAAAAGSQPVGQSPAAARAAAAAAASTTNPREVRVSCAMDDEGQLCFYRSEAHATPYARLPPTDQPPASSGGGARCTVDLRGGSRSFLSGEAAAPYITAATADGETTCFLNPRKVPSTRRRRSRVEGAEIVPPPSCRDRVCVCGLPGSHLVCAFERACGGRCL